MQLVELVNESDMPQFAKFVFVPFTSLCEGDGEDFFILVVSCGVFEL